jgi:hypothetical protein
MEGSKLVMEAMLNTDFDCELFIQKYRIKKIINKILLYSKGDLLYSMVILSLQLKI